MKVDKFIGGRPGSAHIADENQANTTYDGQQIERWVLYEDPRTAKVREEHRIRNVQEAKHRKAVGE